MAIKKIEMFTVICDSCGKSADDGTDYSCWNVESYAEEVAVEAGFEAFNDNHYCKNCHEFDENDELIIKNKKHEITN